MALSEKESTTGKSEKAKTTRASSKGLPAKITAEDLKHTIQTVSDKNIPSTSKELEVPWGAKKPRQKQTLSRTLAFLARISLLNKDGNKYSLSDEGKKFMSLIEEEKKRIVGEKIVRLPYYKDVFIRLKNSKDKFVKKEDVTPMWISIAGGGKDIREEYTTSFSSIGSWSGVLEDTGRTLKLTDIGEKLFDEVAITPLPPDKPPPPSSSQPLLVSLGIDACPLCTSNQIGVKDEQVERILPAVDGHLAYIKYTFYCRNCRQDFYRHGQQKLQGTLAEADSLPNSGAEA